MTKYISTINLNNEDLTIKDSEARAQIANLNVETLNSDVSKLKTDVTNLQSDNATNKSNILALKTDNDTNKNNISKLQNEVIKIAYVAQSEKITITKGE